MSWPSTKRTGGRNWQQRYFSDQGLIRLHERYGLRPFEGALVEATGDRRKARRALEQGFKALLNQPMEGPGIPQLYRELKEKVIGERVPDSDPVDAVPPYSCLASTGVVESHRFPCLSQPPAEIPREPPWSMGWEKTASMPLSSERVEIGAYPSAARPAPFVKE